MSTEFGSVHDALRASGLLDAAFEQGIYVPEARDPDPDELLDPRRTPPRAVCEAALAQLTGLAEQHRLSGRRLERLRTERRIWERRLQANDAKDALAEGRPDGCWCLGFGSRRPLPHELSLDYDGEVSAVGEKGGVEVTYRTVSAGERIFCGGCPEGRAAAETYRERKARHEAASRQAALNARWRNAAIPPEFARATFEGYLARDGVNALMRRAAELVRDWPRTTDWLLLSGPVGVGKTGLACLALRELMAVGGASGLYVVVPDLLSTIKDSFDPHSEVRSSELTDALLAADALLLDDLGVQQRTEWSVELLYRVINTRHLAGRRTLITTNLDLAQLAAQLGDRTVSRIGAHLVAGRSYIQIDGPDLRMVGL